MKRSDLQGLRGIAIIAVLGFHFYPQHGPNGYFGVDLFFVLSGFLMCMLLKRSEKGSPCSLVSVFYSKRFKRILPLYLLVIFLSMIALSNLFPDTAIETNKESATFAILFVSNRPQSPQESYFQSLNIAENLFAHTWSLSVEFQFYFLIPFVHLLGNLFTRKIQLLYYSGLTLLSFTAQNLFRPQDSFYSVFSRAWQFLLGMIAYLTTNSANTYHPSEDEESSVTLLSSESIPELKSAITAPSFSRCSEFCSYICLSLSLFLLSFPYKLEPMIVRPLISISASVLMLTSENNKILTNKMLSFVGDISYSLYLVHWPIYAHWKLTSNQNQYYLFGWLLFSIVLAILFYKLFEQWYQNLSFQMVAVLVIVLYFCAVISINERKIREYFNTDVVSMNSTFDEAAILNKHWNLDDYANLFVPTCEYEGIGTAFGWCRHKGLSSLSKYKMAIIGNSWAANHASLFYRECGYKAKSILQGAASACEPLFPTLGKPNCNENFTDFEVRIRAEHPDYAFILTRFVSIGDPFPENIKDVKDDPIYQVMLKQTLKFIENIKYKLFILNYIPRLNSEVIENIVPMLKNNTDPKAIDNDLVNFENLETARRRHSQLERDCGEKCVFVDYIPEFWNTSTRTFRYFDERGFSYFTSSTHLSPRGLERIRHVWTGICRNL